MNRQLSEKKLNDLGYTGNNNLPSSIFGKHQCFGLASECMFAKLVLLHFEWKPRSDALSN